MKSEPAAFSLADLAARPRRTEHWDGVRNFQARNFMRAMRRGDQAFFYHSSCAEPGIAGVVEVVREAYPDFTAWDPESPHYDPRSTPDKPLWDMVDVRHARAFEPPLPLRELKCHRALQGMRLFARGNRLSIMQVEPAQWAYVLNLAAAGARA